METAAEPKFTAIAQDLLQLKAGGVILGFQQEYEKQRNEVVFSPYLPYILKPNALQWKKEKIENEKMIYSRLYISFEISGL